MEVACVCVTLEGKKRNDHESSREADINKAQVSFNWSKRTIREEVIPQKSEHPPMLVLKLNGKVIAT